MTTPRRAQVSLDDTLYYHCVARCVRRAFLCGEDPYSGRNYEHRRQWLVDRIKQQATVFAIDICAYAVMSNHYHVVVRIDRQRAENWTDHEVIERWCQLFHGPFLVHSYLAGNVLSSVELDTVGEIARVWRQRLMDISWFMRCLNERIAREANKEDHCKGRFWEGRFKSQALLDQRALLSCMAYVDLNPIRAGMSDSLEDSAFTSIQDRLREVAAMSSSTRSQPEPTGLLSFSVVWLDQASTRLIPITLENYIDLVDYSGRMARDDKKYHIAPNAPQILERLRLSDEQWLELSLTIQRRSLQAIGSLAAVQAYNASRGKCWLRGQGQLAQVYDSG